MTLSVTKFIIDKRKCEEAKFEYYLPKSMHIKSLSLKSAMFYNSWPVDNITLATYKYTGNNYRKIIKTTDEKSAEERRNFVNSVIDSGVDYVANEFKKDSKIITYDGYLVQFCQQLDELLKKAEIDHVKVSCDENHVIFELTEDKEFSMSGILSKKITLGDAIDTFTERYGHLKAEERFHFRATFIFTLEINHEALGFRDTKFTKKGKYYSMNPLPFFKTNVFLRSNLVKQSNVLYNKNESNIEESDIFCVIPVDNGDQVKLQRHEPANCTHEVNKTTNYLKFEITDENGIALDFRKRHLIMVFELENGEDVLVVN